MENQISRSFPRQKSGFPGLSMQMFCVTSDTGINHKNKNETLFVFCYCIEYFSNTSCLFSQNQNMEAEARRLERVHVHSVYENIAPYFTTMRLCTWPRVRRFLLRLQPGSLVADVGQSELGIVVGGGKGGHELESYLGKSK